MLPHESFRTRTRAGCCPSYGQDFGANIGLQHMKGIQITLLTVVLILWVGNIARIHRARLQSSTLSNGRVLASVAVLMSVIGLLLPWSIFPSDLGQRQGLTENLDEVDTIILLTVLTLASLVAYWKRDRPRHMFSLLVSLLGSVTLIVVWAAFTFDEQKTSIISANAAYISTLIEPNLGYLLSFAGGALLFLSGLLKNPQSASSYRGTVAKSITK